MDKVLLWKACLQAWAARLALGMLPPATSKASVASCLIISFKTQGWMYPQLAKC